MFLPPGTSHALTWSKQNLLDEATYYVRAVIRDVRTETILDTIDLDNIGDDRYHAYWNVPQDPSGQGRQIEVEKTIYEDSGYTQVSGIYGRWLDRYIVFDFNRTQNTGGYGGGTSVDYEVIRRMMAEELAKLLGLLPKAPEEKEDKTLGARMRELLRIGKKADAIEGLEEKLSGLLTQFIETVERSKKEIAGTTSETSKTFGKETTTVLTMLREQVGGLLDSLDKRLEKKTDDELTHFTTQLRAVLDDSIEDLTGRMDKKLTGSARQTFKSMLRSTVDGIPDEAGEDDKKEPARQTRPAGGEMDRVKRLVALGQS